MTQAVLLGSDTIAGIAPGPHLLITGGVHGDEFEPMAAIRQLRSRLRDSDSQAILKRGRVTLVPVVNQAAFLRGHRTADDALDLARTCPGDPDGTITQRIASALTLLIRSADYYIDLHTGGTELEVAPLTGYMLHPRLDVLDAQRQMARAFNLPIIWGTSADLHGRSLSVARDANVPAIYAEYLGSATCDASGVQAYVDGCLNVMRWLQMVERREPVGKVQTVVEDDRPNSGHMQICNPSPATGFFEAAVALGATVQAGEQLGMVSDDLGETTWPIFAAQSGKVLVLRTFPRVIKGDSVAVILETDRAEGTGA